MRVKKVFCCSGGHAEEQLMVEEDSCFRCPSCGQVFVKKDQVDLSRAPSSKQEHVATSY